MTHYTLGQTSGTILTLVLAGPKGPELDALSARVARTNRWGEPREEIKLRVFEHIIYIFRENRTYDQLFGDLTQAAGDTSLAFFPRAVPLNHHALAERFGVFDRFFVNAEVSPDGHSWSMAAYTTDYMQKTVPQHYSKPIRDRTYDWEGRNRDALPVDDDDVASRSSGRDARESAHLDFRFEDLADDKLFNRILSWMMKGDARPYPPARRMATFEFARAR